jgi:hypothetical protein
MGIKKRYVRTPEEQVEWLRSTPFFLVHVLPLAALWTGVRRFDVLLCASLYFLRLFFITAGYHRYFAQPTRWAGDAVRDGLRAGMPRRRASLRRITVTTTSTRPA